MQRVPMTPEGHAQLTKELKYHKEVLRMKIVQDIEAVMEAQAALVDIVHTLRQVVCVKG